MRWVMQRFSDSPEKMDQMSAKRVENRENLIELRIMYHCIVWMYMNILLNINILTCVHLFVKIDKTIYNEFMQPR